MSVEVEHDGSPWHDGERAAQRAAGVAEGMTAIGRRNIRSYMPEQHRAFFAQLPFVVAAAVDKTGRPWASILSGSPGFATSPDPRRLHVAAHAADGDPLSQTLVPAQQIARVEIDKQQAGPRIDHEIAKRACR